MAVAYTASATQAGSGNTFGFTNPGSSGDVLFAGVANYAGSPGAPTATATGWTFASPNSQQAGTGINYSFCSSATRTYTAGSSTFTLTAGYAYCLGCVAAFSGVDSTGTPTVSAHTGAQQVIPAYSVTNSGSMAVFFLASYADAVPTTITGWTRVAVTGDGFGAIYTKSVSAGDSAQNTGFTDSENSIGWLVILEAAAGGTPSTGTFAGTDTTDTGAFSATAAPPVSTGTFAGSDETDTGAFAATVAAPTSTGTFAGTDAADTGTFTAVMNGVFAGTYPASTSTLSRKWFDQNSDVYVLKCAALWCMPQNGSNADITTVIANVAAAGFNAIKVMMFGYRVNGSFVPFENDAGDPVFTGTAYQSGLGAAWSTMDHIMAQASANGLTVVMSVDSAFGSTGPKAELEAAYTADPNNLYDFGFDVATRYDAYPNIVWDFTTDDNITWGSTLASAFDKIAQGIMAAETTARLWTAENNNGTSSYDQWPSAFTGTGGFTYLRLDANSVYDYGMSSAVQFDAVFTQAGATTYPVWDCEPPYVGGPASGNNRQERRERIYSTLIRGGVGINFGHEDAWPFGPASPFGTNGDTYLNWTASDDVAEDATNAWALLDAVVLDTTWGPTDVFVTTGIGTGGTKAAAGKSTTKALAYFPDSRTIQVDTTILSGTINVQLRWYDPTNGSFTVIAASEAQQTGRSVTHPGTNFAGDNDWVLVVETTGTATGTFAGSDETDTGGFAATAAPPVSSGGLTGSDETDTGAFAGTAVAPTFTATFAGTDAADTGSFAGTAVAPTFTATLTGSDETDTGGFAAAHTEGPTGGLSGSDETDTGTFTGTAVAPTFTATFTGTDETDTGGFAASGPSSSTATLSGLDESDASGFSATFDGNRSGTFVGSDSIDTGAFTATFVTLTATGSFAGTDQNDAGFSGPPSFVVLPSAVAAPPFEYPVRSGQMVGIPDQMAAALADQRDIELEDHLASVSETLASLSARLAALEGG